ncbi:MAG: RHS repeat-associated core domain-containing protein [Bacteroidales bacterium]|nr:RHS repeat-associated core domain-containing protein [Bacteroidales bacterium]
MENGLLLSSSDTSGALLTYSYDELGRNTGLTDPRIGTSVTHYNDKGQVDWIEDAANNRTSFTYDSSTGQKIVEENALNKLTRYAYDDHGQLIHTWGDVSYPIEYTYDTYGRMEEMHTFRNGTGWDESTWPEDTTDDADVTTWHYQESTGLLIAKEDEEGRSVTYTYTNGGKLETRTWARLDGSDPLVTTYVYDPDTGELTSINYSDATPDVGLSYDRLGRQATITDAVGTRSFVYNPTSLQLETETITGLYNKVITRTYDTSNIKGRDTGFYIGSGYSVSYGYEADTGRFKTVGWNVDGNMDNATYSYVPDSDLLQSLAIDSGLTTSYSYESNRNLKTSVQNTYNVGLISQYDYQYDALARRTSVKNSGQAFTQAAFNISGYNDRNELNESNRYIGTDISDTSNPVTEEYRSYNHDSIGNRNSATAWDPIAAAQVQITYTPNPLNQYDQIITDNGTTVTDNPAYDEDGNMTSAALGSSARTLTYNAENRLIGVEPQAPAEGDKKVEMLYDYMGRRIQKQVYTYVADTWTLANDNLFVYDDWNMIQELDGAGVVEKSYVYGLDLSQSLQDAGGVGGILTVLNSGVTYNFLYDANGNVGQLIASSDGSLAARYEYDPFGKEVVAVGAMADANLFRFSTKYYDDETSLYYYGYRYYSTNLGRWINRDPIEERGGINLYVFVGNNSLNAFDPLGLSPHPGGVIPPGEAMKYINEAAKISNLNASELLKELGSGVFNTANIHGETNKWVFTCKFGWIDLGHFFNTSYIANTIKSPFIAYAASWYFEIYGQGMGLSIPKIKEGPNPQSSGTYEDLNSNYEGAYFQHGGFKNLPTNFEKFLRNAGVVNYHMGDETHSQLKKDVSSLLSGNKLEIYEGERIYVKDEQLEYQKKVFKRTFCKFCDGDKAKPEYKY